MHPRTLVLSPPERERLEHVLLQDRRAYLREMAAALLKIADGQSAREVARHGLLRPRKPETVCRWLDHYLAGGIPALVHRPRRGGGISPPAAGRTRRSRAA
jgi:hypothetical protein